MDGAGAALGTATTTGTGAGAGVLVEGVAEEPDSALVDTGLDDVPGLAGSDG